MELSIEVSASAAARSLEVNVREGEVKTLLLGAGDCITAQQAVSTAEVYCGHGEGPPNHLLRSIETAIRRTVVEGSQAGQLSFESKSDLEGAVFDFELNAVGDATSARLVEFGHFVEEARLNAISTDLQLQWLLASASGREGGKKWTTDVSTLRSLLIPLDSSGWQKENSQNGSDILGWLDGEIRGQVELARVATESEVGIEETAIDVCACLRIERRGEPEETEVPLGYGYKVDGLSEETIITDLTLWGRCAWDQRLRCLDSVLLDGELHINRYLKGTDAKGATVSVLKEEWRGKIRVQAATSDRTVRRS